MYLSNTKISDLTDFIKYITSDRESSQTVNVFRGLSNSEFEMVPSLFRSNSHKRQEKSILRELISRHPGEFVDDKTTFDNLVKMQHYQLPTRLLDITYNPLFALYFACQNLQVSGAFVRITAPKNQVKYYDSDTVSILSNLCHFTGRQKSRLLVAAEECADIEEFNRTDIVQDLLYYVQLEKVNFRAIINPDDLLSMFVVKPKQNNRRIIAQQGGFIIFGLYSDLNESRASSLKLETTIIPKSAKRRILRELDSININDSTVFPELERASAYIMGKLSPSADADLI